MAWELVGEHEYEIGDHGYTGWFRHVSLGIQADGHRLEWNHETGAQRIVPGAVPAAPEPAEVVPEPKKPAKRRQKVVLSSKQKLAAFMGGGERR